MVDLSGRESGEAAKGRGREADRPVRIPWRGWLDVLFRVWRAVGDDNLSVVAGGVAFFMMLAVFPALGAGLSLYGILADPAAVAEQLSVLARMMPQQAWGVVETEMMSLVSARKDGLRLGAIAGLLVAVLSASKGVKSLTAGLNVAYRETEKRNFFVLNGIVILLTVVGIVGGLFTLSGVVGLSATLAALDLPGEIEWAASVARWPILIAVVILGLSVLYRFGPSRSEPRWQWISVGAVVAAVLWLFASFGFSWYVASFGNYNRLYGSLGAVIVLLMWFYITAYVILLGAVINGELEHQTARDSTVGEDKPMGERGAFVADTLGELRRPKD